VVELFGGNPSKRSLGRDHGLVEFFWERAGRRWAGTHISVQAHRHAGDLYRVAGSTTGIP
jgi:hypothetical protein